MSPRSPVATRPALRAQPAAGEARRAHRTGDTAHEMIGEAEKLASADPCGKHPHPPRSRQLAAQNESRAAPTRTRGAAPTPFYRRVPTKTLVGTRCGQLAATCSSEWDTRASGQYDSAQFYRGCQQLVVWQDPRRYAQ